MKSLPQVRASSPVALRNYKNASVCLESRLWSSMKDLGFWDFQEQIKEHSSCEDGDVIVSSLALSH